MEELIEKLILYGFPEECAEDIITELMNTFGYKSAEEYVKRLERDLYVD